MAVSGDTLESFNKGATVTITVNFTDSGGTAIDITGYTIWFALKLSYSDADAATTGIFKTVTSHTNPTGGVSTITLSAADTNALTAGKYYYGMRLKTLAGAVKDVKFQNFPENTLEVKQGIVRTIA